MTELRAPFDGIIGLRRVSEGAYASPTVVVAKLTRSIWCIPVGSVTQNRVSVLWKSWKKKEKA